MTAVREKVVAREFRFAYHIPAKSREENDYHFVKEQVHYDVGGGEIQIRPEMRLIPNFERPVWFTRPDKRTHKEKREFEKEENLLKLMVRQSELKQTVCRMTDSYNYHASLRELCASPYVYAADIPSTLVLRKVYYEDLFPGISTPRTVAMFDTETDMENDIKDIIITSACFEKNAFLGIQRRKLEGFDNPEYFIQQAINKHLEKFISEENLKIEIFIADSEIELVDATFRRIHSWRPDFLAIWNMNFDIPKVFEACKRAGVDPADILCDPKTPKHLRFCKYIEGPTKKVTAAGKEFPIKPANQWHSLEVSASFYVIDAMCCYRRIRGGAELPSYSLDAILSKELKLTKLRIPEAEKYKKGKWHSFMQKFKIFEYCAYALFDSYSMLLLDRLTKDLSRTLPYLCEFTSFKDYSSQTKRLRDNFYLFGLESLGIVLGALGPKRKDKPKEPVYIDDESVIDELDQEGDEDEDPTVLDRRNWVITLRSYMTVLGLCLIEEDPTLPTLIRAFVYDSDVVSSYPNCTLVANVSKFTTRKEIIKIENIPEPVFRMQNLNCIFGLTNGAEYSQVMLGLPEFTELDRMFNLEKISVAA